MRNFLSYTLAGTLVVLLLDVIAPPVGFGFGLWLPVDGQTIPQVVDRTHKSDRLPVPRATGRRTTPTNAPLLVGCEPVFSALSKEKQANFPGRCLA